MPRTFVIAQTETEIITATWTPDPEELEQEIMLMASDFEDWTIPLQEGKHVLMEGTQRRFDTETDPDGIPWAPLSEAYYRWKQHQMAGPDLILQLSQKLVEAATSEEAWFVSQDAIFFNAAVLPKNPEDGVSYGMAHQTGTISRERQQRISQFLAQKEQFTEAIAEAILTGSGSGRNLPARPFIGVDNEDINELEAVFINHLVKTVEEPWAAPIPGEGISGISEAMGSNVLGEFPIIGFTKHGQPILRTPKGVRFGKRFG